MNHRQIKRAVNSLTEEQKADLLDDIKLNNGVCMLMGRRVRTQLLNYTVALLSGEEPELPPVSHHKEKYGD